MSNSTTRARGILMNGQNVVAILKGDKTQTRREVKPGASQRDWLMSEFIQYLDSPRIAIIKGEAYACFDHPKGGPGTCIKCPYGQVGDHLWVRETFKYGNTSTSFCTEFRADLSRIEWASAKADALPDAGKLQAGWMDDKPWTPGIHMPRWASRLLLEIMEVSVERVQHISVQDVRAEGCQIREFDFIGMDAAERRRHAADVYGNLWVSINGPESWCANPWVWVVKFRRVWSDAD